MAKRSEKAKVSQCGPERWPNAVAETEKRALVDHCFQQEVMFAVSRENSDSVQELRIKALGDLALAESLRPADNLEHMLINQMIATHRTTMLCFSRAAEAKRRPEERESDLKQATRLMGIFAQQMDALNKHRGKAQQKVTVEHVQVPATAHPADEKSEAPAVVTGVQRRRIAPPKNASREAESPAGVKDNDTSFVQPGSKSVQSGGRDS